MDNGSPGLHELQNLENRVLFSTLNVNSFGAKANDGGDDRAAIIAAFSAAKSGDTIQFGAGTYNISTKLDVPSGLTIVGSDGTLGGNTTLRSSDNDFVFNFHGNGLTMQNLTFDGGALLMDVYNASISNVKIQYDKFTNSGRGGNVGSGAGSVGAPGNSVNNLEIGNNSFTGSGSGTGFFGYNGNNWNIHDNEFINIHCGIKSNNENWGATNVTVTRNYFSQFDYHSVEMQGVVTGFWFTDNYYDHPRLSSNFHDNDSTFAFSLIYASGSSDQHILRNYIAAPERPDGTGVRMGFEAGYHTEIRDNYINGIDQPWNMYGPGSIADGNYWNNILTGPISYGPGADTSVTTSNNGPQVKVSWNINRPRPGPTAPGGTTGSGSSGSGSSGSGSSGSGSSGSGSSGSGSSGSGSSGSGSSGSGSSGNGAAPSTPVLNSSQSWLTDLAVSGSKNGYGPYETNHSNGEAAAGDGGVLTVAGTGFAKGFGVHASSELDFNLNKKYSSLTTGLGVDDEVGNAGSVDFQIFGDGTKLYDSGTVTGTSALKNATVNLTNVSTLKLIVNSSDGSISDDHADWLNPILTASTGSSSGSGSSGSGSSGSGSSGGGSTGGGSTGGGSSGSSGPAFLSDLTIASSTNGYGPVEKDQSNGENAAGDGNTISLRGKTYSKGLGVHASSDITYNLAGKYANFFSDIGIDDETGGAGSVIFQVFGDGKKLYDSGAVTGKSAAKNVNISVAGVQQLKLDVISSDGSINDDHADWAGAKLS